MPTDFRLMNQISAFKLKFYWPFREENWVILDFNAFKDSRLSLHTENVHVGSHENSHEDLDSSQGFRVCNRCDYEAEDIYELDGHLWYGHEEDEDGHVFCKFCDEKFANIPNMMHREKIDFA